VKAIDRMRGAVSGGKPLARIFGFAVLLLCALVASVAQASTVLIANTTLVSGSETAILSFEAPGPGTVSVQLTNLDWPQALSSLSFMASTANQVLSSWSDASSRSFQVAGSGTYFADVMAVAGGSLDLGAYSLSLTFTPAAAPVPLPSSGALLLGAVAAIIGLMLWRRGLLTRAAIAVAPHAAP
jgi:hypothetical protein